MPSFGKAYLVDYHRSTMPLLDQGARAFYVYQHDVVGTFIGPFTLVNFVFEIRISVIKGFPFHHKNRAIR